MSQNLEYRLDADVLWFETMILGFKDVLST